jgi:16S rRNA (uracil1498-N3)-methyltransferase
VAVQGLAKGERSDIAIEALTELGVDELCAWQASRSVVRWDVKADKGLARWATKVAEATKQSRRFRVPQVGYLNTAEVVARLRGAALGLVLHESATTPLSAIDLPESGEIVFVIGPEGGITPEELAAFAEVGALPVSISDAVLRTSTAGVVALAQLQALTAASLRGTK